MKYEFMGYEFEGSDRVGWTFDAPDDVVVAFFRQVDSTEPIPSDGWQVIKRLNDMEGMSSRAPDDAGLELILHKRVDDFIGKITFYVDSGYSWHVEREDSPYSYTLKMMHWSGSSHYLETAKAEADQAFEAAKGTHTELDDIVDQWRGLLAVALNVEVGEISREANEESSKVWGHAHDHQTLRQTRCRHPGCMPVALIKE